MCPNIKNEKNITKVLTPALKAKLSTNLSIIFIESFLGYSNNVKEKPTIKKLNNKPVISPIKGNIVVNLVHLRHVFIININPSIIMKVPIILYIPIFSFNITFESIKTIIKVKAIKG